MIQWELIQEWRHIFKLDPEREISDESLERICMSGTDAIMVGGSSGVTYENTVDLLSRIRRYTVTCVQEISDQEAIVPGFDHYLIPIVMNSNHTDWLIGNHQKAVKAFGTRLPWELITAEGYVILNTNSTVAQRTDAKTGLEEEDVLAYARLAESLFSLQILYIEYSGTFGDMALVHNTKQVLNQTRLFYGGGIRDYESARQAAAAADTIIVGNVIYEHLEKALDTVKIKDSK